MNSKLVTKTILSPNHSGKRCHKITRITPHCMVGQLSVAECGRLFADAHYEASSNYGIGTGGEIGLYVDEDNRSWCSSSADNDNRAITIECASDIKHPYTMNQQVWNSLVDLCVDICQRYGKTKTIWFNDKATTLAYVPKDNEMVFTAHRWFAAKACVPTNSEVLTRSGWVRIGDIEVGDEIACADINNLHISFEEVYDKVPIRQQDTYTNNGLTATKDHRMVYTIQNRTPYRIDDYKHLLNSGNQIYIPTAGHIDEYGINVTDDMIRFFVAVQADGHYMYDRRVDGSKSYYGLEFHLRKERKIERIKDILYACGFEWVERTKGDGSTSIRIYNSHDVNVVTDICEDFLCNKNFTWELLNMSEDQAHVFIDELLLWDGCEAGSLYASSCKENLDIVSAIAAVNGIGSRFAGSNVYFGGRPYITLGKEPNSTKRNSRRNNGYKTEVTCVSVKTGIFLMRQNGKTFITGNCPGDWLYKRMGRLSEEVNKKLSQTTFWPEKEIERPKTGVVYDTEEDREKAIWHFFKVNSDFNDFGIAGLMGNLYSESALRPNNLQNSFEKKLKMTDKSYTTAVNDETYTREQFINDGAGYGLAQWTFRTRKAALYDFIFDGDNGHLASIDDLYLQCAFLLKELVQYKEVYKVLSKAVSVKQASDIVLTQFEKPADQSNSVKNKRAAFGKVYYDKYSDAKKNVVKENLGFYIQYGAFSTKKNAEKRLAEIEKHGFEGKVEKFDGYYRVFHGYFDDRSEVDGVVTAARSKKFDVIVKERKV